MDELERKRVEQGESITKIVEDLSSRFLISWEKQDGHSLILESLKDILKDLQDGLSSSRLHEETQARLSTTISNLQNANEILTRDKNSLADEKERVGANFNELKLRLNINEETLRVKTRELETATVTSKEIPHLKAQLLSLEADKNELISKLEAIQRELLEVKEKSAEAFNDREGKFLVLQQRLSSAELRVKFFEEERSDYVTRKEEENKQACQELTQKAEFSKATMKLKLETEVKNLEQKIKDKNNELESLSKEFELAKAEALQAKNECQVLRTSNEEKGKNILEFEKELGTFKDRLLQQTARLQVLEDRSLEPQEPDDLESRLSSIKDEVSDLRILFQGIKKDNFQLIDLFSSDRKSIENHWHRLHDEKEDEKFIGVEDLTLQESLEMLEASLTDPMPKITFGSNQEKLGIPDTAHREGNSSEIAVPRDYESNYPVAQENLKTGTEPEKNLRATLSITDPKHSNQRFLQKNNDKNEIIISHNLHVDKNSADIDKRDQSNNNADTIVHEENSIVGTPTGQIKFQNNSSSSSFTDIEQMIEALPSVSHPEELIQEYEKIRKPRDPSYNKCRSTSIFSSNSQKILKCGSKRNLNQKEGEGMMLSQKICKKIKENEPSAKRQKPITKVPLMSDVSRHRRSEPVRPIKSSLESQLKQESLQLPSNPKYEAKINFGAGHSGNFVSAPNYRAEPTESNVKQRRQGLCKSNLKGVSYDCGAKHESSPRPVAKML